MATEKEFYENPTICKTCKDFWFKYRTRMQPCVCLDCLKLEREQAKKTAQYAGDGVSIRE